jgi:hypothetical protein
MRGYEYRAVHICRTLGSATRPAKSEQLWTGVLIVQLPLAYHVHLQVYDLCWSLTIVARKPLG